MPTYLSNELAGTTTGLTTAAAVGYKPSASVYQSRLRVIRATIQMAAQTTADPLVLGVLPAGATFRYGVITASATLGASATLAIGVAGDTGRFRTGATFTTANTPTLFGNAAALDDDPVATETTVLGTIGVASLPGSGFFVVDLYYSMP